MERLTRFTSLRFRKPSLDEQKAKMYIGDGSTDTPRAHISRTRHARRSVGLRRKASEAESAFFRDVRYYPPGRPVSHAKRKHIRGSSSGGLRREAGGRTPGSGAG